MLYPVVLFYHSLLDLTLEGSWKLMCKTFHHLTFQLLPSLLGFQMLTLSRSTQLSSELQSLHEMWLSVFNRSYQSGHESQTPWINWGHHMRPNAPVWHFFRKSCVCHCKMSPYPYATCFGPSLPGRFHAVPESSTFEEFLHAPEPIRHNLSWLTWLPCQTRKFVDKNN